MSLVVPVLGPVVEVAALAGAHRTHHVVARLASGAASTLHLSIHLTPGAVRWETQFAGPDGWATVPTGGDAVDAFRVAVARLARNVADGITRDPLDVRAGRDAVAVLAAAQTAADQGRTVRL